MDKDQLMAWVMQQKDTIDKCIEKSAYAYWKASKDRKNIIYDINECSTECFALSRNQDLCYDRPSIGFTYSLWYHGRRINTFLKYFIEIIYNSKDEKAITLYDLGAGTGAIQWACGIIYAGMKSLGINCPKITIVNIDASPFMLEYNKAFLWPSLLNVYEDAKSITTEYSVNSWHNSTKIEQGNHWMIASYLFDHSENIENLKKDFFNLIRQFQPKKILLLSSFTKKHFTVELEKALKQNNYILKEVENGLLFTGIMTAVATARKNFNEYCHIKFSGTPTWNDAALYGAVLESSSPTFDLFGEEEEKKINLYNPPIVVRRDILLNPSQERASIHDGRPTIITGPAGCGKSVVITERVVKVIEQYIQTGNIKSLSILVTTFNKPLKAYLQNWICEILTKKKIIHYVHYDHGIRIHGSDSLNITIYHFDILPTRIWKTHSLMDYPFNKDNLKFNHDFHVGIANEAIAEVKKEEKILTTEYDNILNAEYIIDEYHRVIFGQDYTVENSYLTSRRAGRPVLPYNSPRRKYLFKTVIKYLDLLHQRNYSSIITRRHKFLKKLKTGAINNIYDFIFVDEFQDCTQSDYTIFYRLLKNPNNLILSGDYAQAVHIGKVADIPRDDDETTEKMKNRVYHKLEGSYRLPYRISECIKPISEQIKLNGQENTDVITPYKGAPPGARPILVFADNDKEMAEKIISIIQSYQCFDIINVNEEPPRKISILEKDHQLNLKINNVSNISETYTVLNIKGMEKTCIVWSTRASIDDVEGIMNYIYTIFTRTSGILIIAIFNNIDENYSRILKYLRKDRILIWDESTSAHIQEFYS